MSISYTNSPLGPDGIVGTAGRLTILNFTVGGNTRDVDDHLELAVRDDDQNSDRPSKAEKELIRLVSWELHMHFDQVVSRTSCPCEHFKSSQGRQPRAHFAAKEKESS